MRFRFLLPFLLAIPTWATTITLVDDTIIPFTTGFQVIPDYGRALPNGAIETYLFSYPEGASIIWSLQSAGGEDGHATTEYRQLHNGIFEGAGYLRPNTSYTITAFIFPNQIYPTVPVLLNDQPFSLLTFGTPSVIGATVSNPEPGTLVLCGLGLLAGWRRIVFLKEALVST